MTTNLTPTQLLKQQKDDAAVAAALRASQERSDFLEAQRKQLADQIAAMKPDVTVDEVQLP